METALLSECLVSKPISDAGAATEVGEEHEEHAASLRYGPLGATEYTSSFQIGDIPEAWRPLVAREAQAFRGSWQVLLHRSEPIDDLMKALGINMLKRRVMASYSSVTDVEVTKDNTTGPTLKIATHLPMNCLKQCIVSFDNSWAEQTDVDTGTWKTWSVWIDGRAMQRRQSDLGVMFDVRVIFPSDPVPSEKSGKDEVDIPLMLFKWTFIPAGNKQPISALRWLKKL